MILGLVIGFWVAPLILMLVWFERERRKPISDLDRRLDLLDRELDEQARPPGGSVQARVDQARRDALNTVGDVADTVWPEPGIRHTAGGWRAS